MSKEIKGTYVWQFSHTWVFFSFGLSVNADRVVGIEEKKGRIKPGDAKEEYRLGF